VVLSREANIEMSPPASLVPSSPVSLATPPSTSSEGVVLTPPSTPPTPRLMPSLPIGTPVLPDSLSMLDAPAAGVQCDCGFEHCDGRCEGLP
jgi:hypothetical protein